MLKIKITFDSIGIHNINYDVQKYQIVLTKTFIIPLSNKQEQKTEPIFYPVRNWRRKLFFEQFRIPF